MDLTEILNDGLSWLDDEGPIATIVLSTRVRLARNVAGYLFTEKIPVKEEREIHKKVETVLSTRGYLKEGVSLRLSDLKTRELMLLLEKHLVSQELINRGKRSGVMISDGGRVSLMLGEEDHLRIQTLAGGFQLLRCWERAEGIESELREAIDFAYHPRFGFLTACPTNTGTGLRASVLIHLPGLVLTKEIGKILKGLSQIGLTFRGIYGEGSEVVGNFFQISNQTTLGKSEEELLDHLGSVTQQVIEYEENARSVLTRDAMAQLEDKIWRAFGILLYARSIALEEGMNLLSAIRLGISLKLIPALRVSTLNRLLIHSQSNHLEASLDRELSTEEEDRKRAEMMRNTLSGELKENREI
jgi:protein arginine kinase